MFNFNTNNKAVDDFMNVLEQIIVMPEEQLTEDSVDMILGALKGSITDKTREEAIQATLQDMKGKSKKEAEAQLQEWLNAVADIMEELQDTSEYKQKLVKGILDTLTEFMEEALERLGNYDTKVYFELLREGAKIPTYAHESDAGADVYAPEAGEIPPHARGFKVPVGFKMAMMPGWEMQVRPRSGISAKTALRVANAPGTIDCEYRDEVCVLFDNHSDESYTFQAGDRIAQFILSPTYHFKGEIVENVNAIGENRGGGFGSTGK